MYEAYFNFTRKPFELVPNPDFLYLGKSHRRAATYMDYGISERAGFILLTGEIGSGKTTIIRDLIRKRGNSVILAKIFNTRVDSVQLLAMINDDFGLPVQGKDKISLLRDLNEFLIERYARGEEPVLIIDEAQNLSSDILEEIRMLSNLETDSAKLLQIILVGQPELKSILSVPEMTQLRQRISITCHLQPLNRQETEEYILHRLETAGNRNAVSFTVEAFDIIFRYSRGIPRLINIICDFLLLSAFAEETTNLDGAMARDIVGDLDFENRFWNEQAQVCNSSGNSVATTDGIPPETTDSIEGLLADIRDKLDRIEQDSVNRYGTFTSEMGERMSSLENAFCFHVTETETCVGEMRRIVERIKEHRPVPVPAAEDKGIKQGVLKRMFGQ